MYVWVCPLLNWVFGWGWVWVSFHCFDENMERNLETFSVFLRISIFIWLFFFGFCSDHVSVLKVWTADSSTRIELTVYNFNLTIECWFLSNCRNVFSIFLTFWLWIYGMLNKVPISLDTKLCQIAFDPPEPFSVEFSFIFVTKSEIDMKFQSKNNDDQKKKKKIKRKECFPNTRIGNSDQQPTNGRWANVATGNKQ